MATLLILLAALSVVPLSSLNEKHINYVAEKDFGKGNTRNNISDANGTENCSAEKTPANDSANGVGRNYASEKADDLSESYEEVRNKSFGGVKATNGELIVSNGKFEINLPEEIISVEGSERNRNGSENMSSKSKLLFILPLQKDKRLVQVLFVFFAPTAEELCK